MVKGQVRHGEVWDLNHSVNDGAVVVLGGRGGRGVQVGGKARSRHGMCGATTQKVGFARWFCRGFWVG